MSWCCLFPMPLRYFPYLPLNFFFNHPLTSYRWTIFSKMVVNDELILTKVLIKNWVNKSGLCRYFKIFSITMVFDKLIWKLNRAAETTLLENSCIFCYLSRCIFSFTAVLINPAFVKPRAAQYVSNVSASSFGIDNFTCL